MAVAVADGSVSVGVAWVGLVWVSTACSRSAPGRAIAHRHVGHGERRRQVVRDDGDPRVDLGAFRGRGDQTTHLTVLSRRFQIAVNVPPVRTIRAISGWARSGSNQY